MAIREDPLIGRILHDTHRLVRRIGQGGMGVVYEARHARLPNQRFAVKVLHPRLLEDPTAYRRFKREAEISSQIGHPNIIFVTDFYDTPEGQPCIVMEFLEGESLAARMRRAGRLPPHEVTFIVSQVANALQAVHDQGVIHRDLKPANIFLRRDFDQSN